MKKNKDSLLPSGRVKVQLINPFYPYYGFIIGRDSDFIYLDTDEFMGVIGIGISNIMYVQESKDDKNKNKPVRVDK